MSNACNHSCAEVIAMVNLYLDGELPKEQETTFLQEINNCPHCLEEYNIDKSFKEFIVAKMARRNGSTQLIQSIKDKIRSHVG